MKEKIRPANKLRVYIIQEFQGEVTEHPKPAPRFGFVARKRSEQRAYDFAGDATRMKTSSHRWCLPEEASRFPAKRRSSISQPCMPATSTNRQPGRPLLIR